MGFWKVFLGVLLIIFVVVAVIWSVWQAVDCISHGGIWVTKGFPVGCVGRL